MDIGFEELIAILRQNVPEFNDWRKIMSPYRILDFRGFNFCGAKLRGAELQGTNFCGVSFYKANLHGAYFCGAKLREANFRNANLRNAGLSRADLRGADLREADLRGANLYKADLRGAKINSATKWPASTEVLLARWGEVSDKLCKDLMRYAMSKHPEVAARFNKWAQICAHLYGPNIPGYSGWSRWRRCANFQEKGRLWKPSLLRQRPRTALELVTRLLKEKCICP